MAPEDFKRKLTAVFSADAAGYSRLMGEDEAETVRTLTAYREIMASLIKQHRGRVVDSPGDNLLAEFASVVDAVQCAVAVQNEFQARNAELPENRRMVFRIGINLGDVIEEEGRIYGDGVNIAARLEALAEPGGICVSKTAFDHIETKLPLGYEYLGEQEVKNIAKPVGAYRVQMEPRVTVAGAKEEKPSMPLWRRKGVLAGVVAVIVVAIGLVGVWKLYLGPSLPSIEPASVEKMAFPLPEKPSIAVLPFVNMSGDPEQEYFSDGLTEEIITTLSKAPHMFVIARNSTFTYKGKTVKIQQVAEELGVRYVLEGSVRKSEDRVRVTAQLIDAITGRHLWAERYDRDLKNLFALQDEITLKILKALQVKLSDTPFAGLTEKGTTNLDAYLKLLKAREYGHRGTKEGNAMKRKLSKEVIALDPDYPVAYLMLSATHLMDLIYGTSESPGQSLRTAEELVKKALFLNDNSASGHAFLGRIYLTKRQYEKAIAEGERALALDPNSDFVQAALAYTLRNAGRYDEAIALLRKAIRLNPIPPSWYLGSLGYAYFVLGRYEEALAEFKKILQRTPNGLIAHVVLAAVYSEMDREKDARTQAEEILRIDPKFTLESHSKALLIKNQDEKERYIAALRRAGIPEHPPLPLPDKPSIAVLPFVNMSGDPEQEYFSDGITEEIITALSKTPKLFVIARNSTFTYKGKPVKVQQVGRELGVKYVLEGSVRKAGNKVRVTAQLVDAQTGHHLWAERYDRNLKDIFAVQDEITKKIITALQVKLTEGEEVRVAAKGTNNLEAYLKYLQA
ncbi:MAG: tetratricopeptide repeat protein, partial [Deltaproteobacteria bacterium]|nr:tetratricopeptide repeat protein [Deltaproteobacteria bacterium]